MFHPISAPTLLLMLAAQLGGSSEPIAISVAPAQARASVSRTELELVLGSADRRWTATYDEINGAAEDLTFRWATGETGATGATWMVRLQGSSIVVRQGSLDHVPPNGQHGGFVIPKESFLSQQPPSTPKTYAITLIPHDAQRHDLGTPSQAVIVKQGPPIGTQPLNIATGIFPSLAIQSYAPHAGRLSASADLTLIVRNDRRGVSTDPILLRVRDDNGLFAQEALTSIQSLSPGSTQLVSIHLSAILPPRSSQFESSRYSDWYERYNDRCGAALRASLSTLRGASADVVLAEEGWGDYATATWSAPICQNGQCVDPCKMIKNVKKQLDGNVVGYSLFVGRSPRFESYGLARTWADGEATPFSSKTKITVASVSKMVTAVAAVRILDRYGVGLDQAIGPYLPSDWSPSNYVKNITFAQLLSQQSGIKDYGNVAMTYDQLKTFFEQPVNNGSTTTCQDSKVMNPPNAINPNDKTRCYSNYNFAIFRLLLPKIAGIDYEGFFAQFTSAVNYVSLVQQNVFERVGQIGVSCSPPSSGSVYRHAFAYISPADHANGKDWGDQELVCGAAGWYLSIEDIAKLLLSIDAKDGKILKRMPDQFEIMRTRQLGWDVDTSDRLEKNGGFRAPCATDGSDCRNTCRDNDTGCRTISTSVAIFHPTNGPRIPAALFINSEGSQGADSVLKMAYDQAVYQQGGP